MKLRLLARKEVDVLRARERQAEINEGAKLARRVDGLRELQAEEEANLNKWRTETLTSIQAEIYRKMEEEKIVSQSLEEKRREVAQAFEPLKQERLSLNKEREKIDLAFIEIELQKANLDEVLQMNGALQALNQKELAKRALEKQEYEQMFFEANEQLKEAESILEEARQNARSIRDTARAIEAQVRRKEKASIEREIELSLQAALLKKKEAELERRELEVIVKELQYQSPVRKL